MNEVEWVGSPAVPEQLLAAAQAALVAKDMPEWTCPLAPPLIKIIVRIQSLTKQSESLLAEGIEANEHIQQKVESLHSAKAAIKRKARAFRAGTWQFLCKASLQEDLDDLIEDIGNTLERALRSKRSRGSARSSGSLTPRRLVVEKEKNDEDAPISSADSARLNEFVRRKATNEITIEDAKILLEAMGNFIDNLYPGGSDL